METLKVKLQNGNEVIAEIRSYLVQQWNAGAWENIAVYAPYAYTEAEEFMNSLDGYAQIVQLFLIK